MSDGERFSRAGSYVLGLMDEHTRERAERDLEVDPAFRDAVLEVAERMHKIDMPRLDESAPAEHWKRISVRIAEMPQMRGLAGRAATKSLVHKVEPVGQGLHAMPTRRALIIAVALIVTFAAGYLAARWPM